MKKSTTYPLIKCLNSNSISNFVKNSYNAFSDLLGGVFNADILSGCSFLVFKEFANAFSLTSFLLKDDECLSFSAIERINSLLALFLSCLTCSPFSAKL